jgi:hypothetical protein
VQELTTYTLSHPITCSLSSDISRRVPIHSGEEIRVLTWLPLYGGSVGLAEWDGMRVYVTRHEVEPGWVSPLALAKEQKALEESKEVKKSPWDGPRWGRKKSQK